MRSGSRLAAGLLARGVQVHGDEPGPAALRAGLPLGAIHRALAHEDGPPVAGKTGALGVGGAAHEITSVSRLAAERCGVIRACPNLATRVRPL
jgi:hypothetical protein